MKTEGFQQKGHITLAHLALDDGTVLAPVTLAYETWGRLNAAGDNAILVCHALTGDAHAYDTQQPDDPRAGWWNPLIGPGRVFDTTRFFVVCSNVLGSCYGSVGPTSPHPLDKQPYRLRFPLVSVGDMVRAQQALLERLGVKRLAAVAGGSLGGLQALEWPIAFPEMVERAMVIAASPRLSAQGLAIDTIARQAILCDAAWQDGNYPPGAGPAAGLNIARMLGILTYTSAEGLEERFGRRLATRPSNYPTFGPRLDIETYFQHQGEKLVRRFDANCYLYLSSAMDRYDAAEGPGRGSDAAAFARIQAEVLAVGIDSDWLYPARQVRDLAAGITAAGGRARYVELRSPHGHDAFLKEWEQLDALLRPFLAAKAPPIIPPLAGIGEGKSC
ncbi:MAG TPA: homoserine O-acetyltransferase [Ktedonobacterales bacterium]|jgi:homoserine O-acetyltransferase